jgi:hypothetical protein
MVIITTVKSFIVVTPEVKTVVESKIISSSNGLTDLLKTFSIVIYTFEQ